MCRVVGDDEQAGDHKARKHPEGDRGERIVDEDQAGHGGGVDHEVAGEIRQALPRGVVVGGLGDDVDHRQQRTLTDRLLALDVGTLGFAGVCIGES